MLVVSRPKIVDEFRISEDTRYPNSQIESNVGCLPILEVILPFLKDSTEEASLDAFRGFWQFPLHEGIHEIYSILSDIGKLIPERIIQGSTDVARAFEAEMY